MPDFRDLSALLDPKSIAIVGASPKSGWPARIWANLQHFQYPGKIYPVNPNYETMWGLKCYPSLHELPEVVDQAIIIIPAARVVELLQQSSQTPFRSATIYSGGFGEGGDPEGLKRKEFVQVYARERDVHFCGPNCMGLVSTRSRAMFFPDVRLGDIRPGGLAIVSQSGGLLGSLVRAAMSWGIGLSYFVTSGNEADAELSDYLHHFLNDERTKVIGAFVEGVRDGEKFVAVAQEALALGKPIIALKVGRSEKAGAAALAHTGALAGNDRVFDAVCLQNGVLRVQSLDGLLNAAELFMNVNRISPGRRTAFVTFSGGLRGLLSDLSQDADLELSQLKPETEAELNTLLGVGSAVGNPLDTGWGGLSSQETYLKCVDLLLKDPSVDQVALQEELPQSDARPDKESNLRALAEVARESFKPIAVFSAITQSINDYALQFKQSCRLPFLQGAQNTVQMMRHLGTFGEAAQAHRREGGKGRGESKPLSAKATEILSRKKILSEWEAYQIMSECGLPLSRAVIASNPSEAVRAAEEIDYPVAVKLIASGITHKSELGGVKLNLSTPDEVSRACREIEAAFHARHSGVSVEAFLVQEMIQGGVETIIGTDNDPQFGPVVMFGLGGTAVEVYRDVTFRMAPVTLGEAAKMIRGVKGYPLLAGFRGTAPVDEQSLCRAIVAVSELAAAGRDLIQSIEINPFICPPQGGKAVDAVIVTRSGAK
ncbi:MAG TPA: acetate--CoA ligase family protein [Candidatus Binatia bacterium]|jgi:acetyltransferase|nr:acetate--CoA ligase family protein [Candidatus Binatia bacterium]